MSRKTREQAAARVAEMKTARTRRNVLLGIGGSVAAAAAGYGFFAALSAPPSSAGDVGIDVSRLYPHDVVYGSQQAAVTVMEYASLTCIHCARFHVEALPAFLKGWVDTGKAKLVYRHFPMDGVALAAAGAVSGLPAEERAAAVSSLMSRRDEWLKAENPVDAAIAIIADGADAQQRLKAKVAEGRDAESLAERIREARTAGVSGTPSFVVRGKLYVGFMAADKLGSLVDNA